MSATSSQLLHAAAEIVGGARALASRLAIDEILLAAYMADRRVLPDPLLLRAVDIVLADRHPRAKDCAQAELVCLHAVRALAPDEVGAVEAHLTSCAACRAELAALHPVVDALTGWADERLVPSAALRQQLALRIAASETEQPKA
jgi:hypothetical protein